MSDELLIMVNEQDQIIGQMLRSEVYARKLNNFRVVNAFIMNSQGQLWIPRRTKEKRLFPLALDASMGGHVMAGETYQEALAREIQEELNIDVSAKPFTFIGSLNPHTHGTSAFMQVFVYHSDEAPNYNPIDYIEYYWLHPHEVLDMIEKGEPSKGDLPIMIRSLFGQR